MSRSLRQETHGAAAAACGVRLGAVVVVVTVLTIGIAWLIRAANPVYEPATVSAPVHIVSTSEALRLDPSPAALLSEGTTGIESADPSVAAGRTLVAGRVEVHAKQPVTPLIRPSVAAEPPFSPAAGEPAPAPPAVFPVHPVELSALDLGPTLVPSAPAEVRPTTPASAIARPPVARSDVNAVMRTLTEYAEALTRMDVRGAARAWPSVDHRALSGAFETLEKNDVELNACAIEVGEGKTAVATCRATVQYVPKVGGHTPRLTSQQWRFTMNRVVDDWKIQTATAFEER